MQIKNHNEISSQSHQNDYYQKDNNTKHWRGRKDWGTPIHCWECKLEQSLWKMVCRFLQKLNMELPYDPAIPLLGI